MIVVSRRVELYFCTPTAVENFGSEVVRRLELTTAEFLSIKTGTGIPILLLLSVINLVPIVVGPFVSQSPANRATKLTRKGLNRSVSVPGWSTASNEPHNRARTD